MPKKEIIFIVGMRHSGSSITARLLNTVPRSLNVGEINSYSRYYSNYSRCSCGSYIHECDIWMVVGGDIDLTIRIRDIVRPSKLKIKARNTIWVYNKLFAKNPEIDTIIDNSKQAFRAGVLVGYLKKEYAVKVYFTKRDSSKMLASIRKRHLMKKYRFLMVRIFGFFSEYTLKGLLRIKGVPFDTIQHEQLKVFVQKHHNELNINKISEQEYLLNDYLDHSIGGSRSSKNSYLRIK